MNLAIRALTVSEDLVAVTHVRINLAIRCATKTNLRLLEMSYGETPEQQQNRENNEQTHWRDNGSSNGGGGSGCLIAVFALLTLGASATFTCQLLA